MRRKWVLGCIAVGAFLLAFLLAFAPSAAARTTIAWQPSHQDDTGYAGWHEYLICKDIHDRTVAQLPSFTNVLAWETTMGLWGTNNGGGTNRRAFDSEIVQANAAGSDIFISIHVNGNSPSGFTGFYFSGDAASARYAESLMKSVAAAMDMPYLGKVGMDFYSLDPVRNKAPIRVLLELGDNVRDRALLSSVEGRQKIADALAKAVGENTAQAVTPCSSLRGSDRYDTAIRISKAMFPDALPADSGVVLAPGETFQEALCGAPLAGAYGGPVLLTYRSALANNVTTELQRLAPKHVICIGFSSAVVDAVKAALPTATVTAINGDNGCVYDMSYKVAKALQDKVTGYIGSATAIITRGDVFPDAIGVSPLAYCRQWPVLLTDKGDGSALNPYAAQALSELEITQALKVGTYAQLPAGVTGVGNCSGADRYYTNANVAKWAQACAGLSFSHTGIATGDKFPDALAVGPYLARNYGILLLSPLHGPLPAPIASLLYTNRTGILQVSFIACVEPVIGQVKAVLP